MFICRYLDLFTRWVSLWVPQQPHAQCLCHCRKSVPAKDLLFPTYRYNTMMKLIFLVSSLTIIYYMRVHPGVRRSYDREQDTFRVPFLLVPCAVLALLVNQGFEPMEVGCCTPGIVQSEQHKHSTLFTEACGNIMQILWTFSIYLEAVAILPQLVLLQRTQNIDNLTGNYVFLLG